MRGLPASRYHSGMQAKSCRLEQDLVDVNKAIICVNPTHPKNEAGTTNASRLPEEYSNN